MRITHAKVASPTNRVNIDDFNADHVIEGLYGYGLVESKILGVGSTQALFESLSTEMWDKYLLEFGLIGTGTGTLLINFNGDVDTNNYAQYIQMQEDDGNSHHLTNWGANNAFSRFYPSGAFITNGNVDITAVGDGKATWREEFSMYNNGWGEGGGTWRKGSGGFINSIKISVLEAVSFQGYARLYKLMDLGSG